MNNLSNSNQTHVHGPGCGHKAIIHGNHTDYLRDGHLEHEENSALVEHVIPVSLMNPEVCTPEHTCAGHAKDHQHRPGCGHEIIPHGDHLDYLVSGHLHHPHGKHCDNHGPVQAM